MSRKHPLSSPGLLFVFLALGLAIASASSGQILQGTVTDEDKNPLPGVSITVTSPQVSYHKNLTSDEDGTFVLRFTTAQTRFPFEFLFEKPGYQSFTQTISPSATRAMRETFVMNLSETRPTESHGDLGAVLTGADNEAIEAFNAGLTAQRERDLDTARTKLEEALGIDPDLAPAQIALAQVLADQGESEEALAAADRALELAPGRVEALRVKYQALRALRRTEEAEALSAQLASAEDSVASARRIYNEGGEAFQAGDQETALAKFTEATKLDPTLVDAHHAVATLRLARGEHEAAAESAQKALDLGSDNVATLRVLYDAYDALGRQDELVDIAPRLASVDPEFGGAKLLEQAAALWNGGQTEAAVALSRQALAIDSSLAKAHYFLGLDHLSKGENAEARAELETFIEMAPDDAEAATAREMLTYIE